MALEPLYEPTAEDAESLKALEALAEGEPKAPVQEPTQEPAPPDYEAEAREQGWVPKEDFKGDPAKWKPAKEFVEYGDSRINGLKRELDEVRANSTRMMLEIRKQQQADAERAQRDFASEKARYEARIRDLTESKYRALGEGDIDAAKGHELELNRLRPPTPPTPQQEAEPPHIAMIRQAHPDMDQILGSSRFQMWLMDQPPALQAAYYSSPHPEVGIEILNRHKRDLGGIKAQPNVPPSPVGGVRPNPPQKPSGAAFSSLSAEDRRDFQTGVSYGVYQDTEAGRAAFAKHCAESRKRG